jgi:hypothetical protein
LIPIVRDVYADARPINNIHVPLAAARRISFNTGAKFENPETKTNYIIILYFCIIIIHQRPKKKNISRADFTRGWNKRKEKYASGEEKGNVYKTADMTTQ